MNEEQWLATVTDLAHAYGWYDYHVDRSAKRVVRRSGLMIWATNVSRQGKGFPDLVLVRERDARLIFAELKADDGRATPEQKTWLSRLETVAEAVEGERAAYIFLSAPRIGVYLWRPRDYDDVERILRPAE